MKPRIPLRYSMLGALLILGAALTVIAHYSNRYAAAELIESEVRDRLLSTGARNAVYLSRDVARGDHEAITASLALLFREPHLIRAEVYDERDRLLASTGPRAERPLAQQPTVAALAAKARATEGPAIEADSARSRFLAAFPIRVERSVETKSSALAVLYIEYDFAAPRAAVVLSLRNRTLMIGTAALLLVAAFAGWYWMSLTRGMERLTTAFQRVGEGDFNLPAVLARPDELGRAFARMVQELQRKRIALAESDARYRNLVEMSPDAIIVLKNWRICFVNPAAIRLFGARRAEDIVGRLAFERLHPDERASATARSERWRRGEALPVIEERWLRMDGSVVEVEVSVMSFLEEGELIALLAARDISDRKRQQEALAASEARLADIVATAMDAIVSIDAERHITLFNRAAETIFGWRAADMIGESVDRLIPERYRAVHRKHVQVFGASGVPGRKLAATASLYGLRANGEEFPFEASISQSQVAGAHTFTIILRDLTERARSAAEQKRLEKQLLQSQKLQSLGTLAGGIAHDFNNILLAIRGHVRLALEGCRSGPVHGSLMEIQKASQRAVDLVHRILTFSRPDEAERNPVALEAVATDVVRLLRALTPAMIEFRVHSSGPLSNVLADAGQLHQVIMNLCTNAAHAMNERGGVIDICLDAVYADELATARSADLHEGEYVRLNVIDNGRGMDARTLERIFDPFFTTKPQGQGTGLGLSIVHGIVKNHGGAINVYSEFGKGTRVEVWLPASAAARGADGEAPTTHAAKGDQQHVLYVDDEEALVILTSRVLKRLNYRISAFSDPLLALAALKERPFDFDALITDLAMPGMSGFDVARTALEVRADLPVILTSGYVREQDREEAQHLGVYALILKPDTIEGLANELHELFTQRATLQATAASSPIQTREHR